VIMDSALASEQIVSFVATDNYKGGQMGADALGPGHERQGQDPAAALRRGLGQHHRARGGLPRQAEELLARARAPVLDQYAGATRDTPSAPPRTC
jgi:ribose transport system substrate-binding protein